MWAELRLSCRRLVNAACVGRAPDVKSRHIFPKGQHICETVQISAPRLRSWESSSAADGFRTKALRLQPD
ncbi:hypothetical protein GJAV_G00133450 [Gymnothorax javanicus]|nr:hypothetical protein GJAV_G00133450 [Gymnothorax javanicus]